MKWVNILHIYQPPTQTKEIVDQVVRESYSKVIELLDRYPNLHVSMNVAGSLLELLLKYGHEDVIAGIKRHAERGAVELLGSAMYHPILPLLSAKEIKRQIKLHDDISRRCFGAAYAPRGFYFPEMAYSKEAAQAVKAAGFEWTVLDAMHTTEKIDWSRGYVIQDVGLKVIFRDSRLSRTFPPESIVKEVKSLTGEYVITCHDGELYGHWHKDDRGYYEKAFAESGIELVTASQYIDLFAREGQVPSLAIPIRDASWESLPEELERNNPLSLWNDPQNQIHQMLEDLKRCVLTAIESHQDDPGYAEARHHADRGVASCAWWWASERKLGPFSPITWNPTEIEKGARELETAFEFLQSATTTERDEVRSLYEGLMKHVWDKHRARHILS